MRAVVLHLLGYAVVCAWQPQLRVIEGRSTPKSTSRCQSARCASDDERRLVPRTGNPALVWFDELFDTPSEKAERERLVQENIAKWGVILRGKDTFDDELPDEEAQAPSVERKTIGGISAEWAIVGGSTVTLLACAVASRGGSPTMGFADWGKGARVATASHILMPSRDEALKLKEKIEQGRVSFADAAEMFSSCGSAAEGGSLGSFAPGEMVPAFDAYCFDPATPLDVLGVVESEFGVHLVKLEKQNLGTAEGKSQTVLTRRMFDTPDEETGLRS